jgi:hypothetical protein
MSLKLQDSVILISSSTPNNNRFGTGFVVHQDKHATYLLTCAHVVRDVGGQDQVEADGSNAIVIASGEADGIDLAVLRVEGLFDKQSLGLRLSGEKGTSFITAGYQSFDKGFLIREIRGNLAGQTGFKYRGQTNRVRTWDLKTIDEYHLQPGCSGSPVVDESNGYVLGIVSHRIGESEKGVAISIEALEKIWQDIPFDIFKTNAHQASEPTITPEVIEIFLSYSPKDEKLRDQLEESLSGLDYITVWHDGKIGAGKNRQSEISKHLKSARLILLLISRSFISSEYHRNYEVKQAMERYKAGEDCVIPIELKLVANWKRALSCEELLSLPRNGKPVTSWTKREEAFFSIAEDIRQKVEELTTNYP